VPAKIRGATDKLRALRQHSED